LTDTSRPIKCPLNVRGIKTSIAAMTALRCAFLILKLDESALSQIFCTCPFPRPGTLNVSTDLHANEVQEELFRVLKKTDSVVVEPIVVEPPPARLAFVQRTTR
jgi:hypothetical protein